MPFPQEIFSSAPGIGKELASAVGGAAVAIASIGGIAFKVKALKRVEEGQMAVWTHRGRTFDRHGNLYGIVGSGYYVVGPGRGTLRIVSIQDHNEDLDVIVDRHTDGPDVQYEIPASIIWGVKSDKDNPYKALFKVENETSLTMGVTKFCKNALWRTLCELPDDKFENRFSAEVGKEIDASVKTKANAFLEYKWGAEVRLAYLTGGAHSLGEKLSHAGSQVVSAAATAAEVFPGRIENGAHENGNGQALTIPPPIT